MKLIERNRGLSAPIDTERDSAATKPSENYVILYNLLTIPLSVHNYNKILNALDILLHPEEVKMFGLIIK